MHLSLNRWVAGIVLAAVLVQPAAALLPGRPAAPDIPLQKNLRLLVRPTLLGLVPPADPESYGEMFVRITAATKPALTLRYEVKEALLPVEGSKDETTRIRRGEIGVTGLADAPGMIAPIFWPDGDFATETALLWLSRASYAGLVDEQATAWELDFAREEIPAEFQSLNDYIGELRTAAEFDPEAPVMLEVTDDSSLYPCLVNGERTALPVIRAADNLGLAEYWILKDKDNPLVLKMSFIPPEGSITGDEPLGLVRAGSGYAVVEIDY